MKCFNSGIFKKYQQDTHHLNWDASEYLDSPGNDTYCNKSKHSYCPVQVSNNPVLKGLGIY